MERSLNIIKRAVDDGFEFDFNDRIEDVLIQAIEWFEDYPADEEREPDYFNGSYLLYDDGNGYVHERTGEFYTHYDYQNAIAKGKRIHLDRIIDTDANIIDLFLYPEDE